MKRIPLLIAALAFSLAAAADAPAFEIESLSLHLSLAGRKNAGPPETLENHLILSAKGAYRWVGAAFEDEDYREVHLFDRNQNGVFVLAYPIPLKRREPLAYRLVIDGVWLADPNNPRKAEDRGAGVILSLADVPYLSDERPGDYRLLADDGRTARFRFRGTPGEAVTVAGTFNNWDPFLHELTETAPGLYELELALPPGLHYYAFVSRGEYRPDPLNPNKATSREGRVVSVLVIGELAAKR